MNGKSGVNKGSSEGTHLGGPSPIAAHPITVDMALSVCILVDSSSSKQPFSFICWVSEERLDAFKWIPVEEYERFDGLVTVEGNFLHLPFRCLQELFYATA